MVLEVKNLSANVEDTRDVGLIPGSGRPPRDGTGTHSSILTCNIPEEPGGLQSVGSQRVGHD